LCRQMSSCNQSERDAIFGRDSCERKLSNHHDQGRRQGATAIKEFFSITHTSKNFEGARGRLSSSKGGACAMAQWPVQAWLYPSIRVRTGLLCRLGLGLGSVLVVSVVFSFAPGRK